LGCTYAGMQLRKLLEESGYNEMMEWYRNVGVEIKIVDFRGLTTQDFWLCKKTLCSFI